MNDPICVKEFHTRRNLIEKTCTVSTWVSLKIFPNGPVLHPRTDRINNALYFNMSEEAEDVRMMEAKPIFDPLFEVLIRRW